MKSHKHLLEAEYWIFDLDNTLYPAQCQLFTQIEQNMTRYVMDFLKLGHDDAYSVQKKYFKDHGTTMNGLMIHHNLDPNHYLDYVHQIDLSGIPKDQILSDALAKLPGKKIIFTNGSTGHASRVIKHLGIEHHFEGIFDIVDSQFTPKPDPSVYEILIKRFGIRPEKAVMVEDMAKNLRPAADLGMTTVWVRTDSSWASEEFNDSFIHHIAEDLTGWLTDTLRSAEAEA
jgi:putative hydrolase of the HAD superfamily